MSNTCVVGLQWGDEAKGKVVDVLAREADAVVRYQGGANAGHTVVVDGQKFVLHLLPCGVLWPGKLCVIGNGVVIDPDTLREEVEDLRRRGVPVGDNLRISDRAQVILPYHKKLDGIQESSGSGTGTTRRGIGPCYADKAGYKGLRVADLMDPAGLRARIERLAEEKNRVFARAYGVPEISAGELYEDCRRHVGWLAPFVCDTSELLTGLMAQGKRILFEGAQGTMLDVDHGTYPFVTGSNASACGVPAGAGIPPKCVGRVLGVTKAYTTRVGDGPFPSELNNDIGAKLRGDGGEYGATTGRARRCGWLDAVICRYTARLNGADAIAVTKLDVLTGLEKINICVAYELEGKRLDAVPAGADALARAKPVYEARGGWSENLSNVSSYDGLPAATRDYVARMEELIGVPVTMVSVGPDRRQILRRN